MNNPAHFTVIRHTGTRVRARGLFGSRDAGLAEAERLRKAAPHERYDVAIVTMLEQDPATGTPMGHLAPRNPYGFVIASLSHLDPARRRIDWSVNDLDSTSGRAAQWRSRTAAHAGRGVFDVVALTTIDRDPSTVTDDPPRITTEKDIAAP
jgi:hypothetical protein